MEIPKGTLFLRNTNIDKKVIKQIVIKIYFDAISAFFDCTTWTNTSGKTVRGAVGIELVGRGRLARGRTQGGALRIVQIRRAGFRTQVRPAPISQAVCDSFGANLNILSVFEILGFFSPVPGGPESDRLTQFV